MRIVNNFLKLCKKPSFKYIVVNCQKIHFISIGNQNISKNTIFTLSYVNYAKLHITSQLNAKSFPETENEYAHEVLENLSKYEKSIVKQPLRDDGIDCKTVSSKELQEFAKLTKQCMSQNIDLGHKSLNNLITRLLKIISTLSDEELVYCLHLLCLWPPTKNTYTPNFKVLWNNLDDECVRRLLKWDSQQQLIVADYWFHLRLSRLTAYNKHMIRYNVKNLSKLSDPEFVQLMFYINLQREISNDIVEVLEGRLISLIDSSSLDELCVVCLGFFKTQSKINDFSVIKSLMNRFLQDIENINEITIVAMLKLFKKSFNSQYVDAYVLLLHKCFNYVNKWGSKTCVHLALLASECHIYHPLLLNAVTEKITKTMETIRLKDCTKLLQCLGHFNHLPSSKFNQSLMEEYQKPSRQDEIAKYPRDLIYATLYYAYMDHYNYDLLNIVLNPDFIENCTKLFPESKLAFIEVDCCIEIECRDYQGFRLNKRDNKFLEDRRKPILNPTKPNMQTRLTNEVMQSLESISPSKKNYRLTNILPHVSLPDIVVQLSGNPDSLWSSEELILKPPIDELWACIVIGGPFSFAYDSRRVTGITAMKLRQLEKLGYQIIFIPYKEFPFKNIRAKVIRQKLEAILKNSQIKSINNKIK